MSKKQRIPYATIIIAILITIVQVLRMLGGSYEEFVFVNLHHWGWGIASLMKAEGKPLIKTGALIWKIWLFICFGITGVVGTFSIIDLPNDHYEYHYW